MRLLFFKKLKRMVQEVDISEPLENVYTRKEFLVVLNRARAQADRNGHCFALATFDVTAKGIGSMDLEAAARLLSKRVRATDAIGWFDERRLGIYLYDSNAKDAQGFCQEVQTQLGYELPHQVYVYPYFYKQNLPADQAVASGNPSIGVGMERYEKMQYTLYDSVSTFPDQTRWWCSSECDIADDYSEGMEPVFRRRYPLWKRTFDLSIASAVLLFCLPVFLSVALFVKFVSPGPIFFKQARVGYLGRRFTLWKFRTMHVNNSVGTHRAYMQTVISNNRPQIKLENDPSIIPFGKYLRASGVDELPQLLNVLKGEMSLIGPRPPIPYEVERYHRWFHGRFDTMPGLTGLWQVSGKNRLSFQEMIRLDIRYKKRLSLFTDIIILLRTPTAILQQISDLLLPQRNASRKIIEHRIKSNV